MNLVSRILFVFIVKFAFSEAGVRPTECQIWEKVVSTTMAEEFLNVTCAANDLCTGFGCYGSLLFKISSLKGMEPFGFSLEFIPCSYPLVLRIRMNSSDLEFMKLLGVHGRNQESIVLLTPDDDGGEKSYGRLNVAWNAVLKPVKYFVALEVNFTRIFLNGEFPSVPLVPHQEFPVPNCQYGPVSDVPRKPKEHDRIDPDECEGNKCTTQSQNSILHKLGENIDSDLIVKFGVGAGSLLLTLCVLVGIFLVRRRRRARKLQKLRVDNDLKGESEEEDGGGEEEDSPSSTPRNAPEDRRKLLLV